MNSVVARVVFERKRVSVTKLVSLAGASIYSVYKTVGELRGFGVISFDKGIVELLQNNVASAFSRLFFEGFDVELLSEKNVLFLSNLLDWKNAAELSKQTGFSTAKTNRLLNNFSQFLSKQENKYKLSEKNGLLKDFLVAVNGTKATGVFWSNGMDSLLKLPKQMPFEGALTAFSCFPEFGLSVFPSHNFVLQPARSPSVEETLVHAIKFSQNANDILLCSLFYLRNKHRINVLSVEKLTQKFGVSGIWLDMVSFFGKDAIKRPELFVSWQEFLEKAKQYGIRVPQKFGNEAVKQVLEEISKRIGVTAQIYMIGGNALMEYQIKNATKDIDLVVETKEELRQIVEALKKAGFSELAQRETQYEQLGTSAMLEKADLPRVDLFAKKICNALEFSKKMRERSRKISDGKAEIWLASLEDIFLLKSISSRDSDIADCEAILSRAKINWKIIESELLRQEENLKNLSDLVILDHLETLEKNLAIKIPLTKKLVSIAIEKGILFLAKKPISIKEILQKIDFPESTVRNKVQQLAKAKKIAKIKGKPFRVVAKE